ncbi:MAG TPA: methyltransferase domain-containing protein [Alphaproteobacteria bacterium]
MIYKSPRLSPKKTGGRYYHLTRLRNAYINLFANYIPQDKPQRLIDYGCGAKPYLELLQHYRDLNYTGADFPDVEKRDIDLGQDGGLKSVQDKTMDILLSSQVLEHVTDVGLYLSECRRVLKDDGLMFLSTHGYWMYHPNPTDYWRWTRDGLLKTLRDNGFEIRECVGVMGLAASGLQLFQDGVVYKIPKCLRGIFHYVIAGLQKIVDGKPKNHLDACVYVVVAMRSGV